MAHYATYRVLHDYTPSRADQSDGYLVIKRGDLLEVPRPVQLDEGTEENPKGWLRGMHQQTRLEGYFPSGEFVEYVSRPLESAPRPHPPPRPSRSGSHRWNDVYFVKPVQCAYCSDYIWGIGSVGKQCEGCASCVHSECPGVGVCTSTPTGPLPPTHREPVPVSEWSVDSVLQWMAVVNLYRYSHIFRLHSIDGNALQAVTVDRLKDMQVFDEFHQQAIMAAVGSLCHYPEINGNSSESCDMIQPYEATADDHSLALYSFSSLQNCHICHQLLLGLVHQGFQCQNCGLCCHRRCCTTKLPTCQRDPVEVEGKARPSFASNEIFRMPLDAHVSSCSETPGMSPVVQHCTCFLEKSANADSGLKLVDMYRISCTTEEIEKIKSSLCHDGISESVIAQFKPECVAGLLKKYLRELPEAVIPEQFYQEFIDAAKLTDDCECGSRLFTLIDSLPPSHLATLHHLVVHFRFVCWPTVATTQSTGYDPVRLMSEVFCDILLRPPWSSILDVVQNSAYHRRVISTLIHSSIWTSGVQEPSTADSSLDDAEWYWANISRDDASKVMNGTKDGSFLVRDANDRVSGNYMYTLMLRKDGHTKRIRIGCKNGRYGFAEPYRFSSVVELISYYRVHSLSEYNESLDVLLRYPMQSIEGLKKQYLAAHSQYSAVSKEFTNISEQHMQIVKELELKQQALYAFRETVNVFNEQIKMNEKHHSLVAAHDLNRLRDNLDILARRVHSIVENQISLEKDVQEQTELSRGLVTSMNSLKPEVKRLFDQREQYKQQLLQCGVSAVELDRLVERLENPDEVTDDRPAYIPHNDERTWFVDCDRTKAIELLSGQEEGTFLIRPKEDFTFVLSIVKPVFTANSNEMAKGPPVAHCIIKQQDTGFFGFAEPYYIHRSLKDLVLHYREQSLFEHNDELDTTLRIPVYSRPQDQTQDYVMVDLKKPR